MISGSREKDFSTKQEGGFDLGHDTKRVCTSKAWPLLKDPRIVRASRSLGKKDRHSKVSTIRGLRDRRVRLSVQTAIQLYDLQDRLGLNQPSKVVDWLLNAAQQEINELPPLPILQGSYISQPQSIPSYHANLHQAPSTFILDKNSDCFKDCGSHSLSMLSNNVNEKSNDVGIGEEQLGIPKNLYWNPEGSIRVKSKDANREMDIERSNWNKRFGQEARNPFHVLNNSSSPRSVSNALAYNSYFDRDSANASTSHSGGHVHPFQIEGLQHSNVVPVPSSISLSSGSQLLLCPSTIAPSTLLPFISNPSEYDSKQANHSQVLSINPPSLLPISLSTSIYPLGLAMRSLQVNMNQKHQHYQSSPEGQAKSLARGNESNISSINVQMYGSEETLD